MKSLLNLFQHKLLWLTASFALTALLFPSNGNATVIIGLSLDDLCLEAEYIVIAKVSHLQSHWSKDEEGRMLTTVCLDVREWLKGKPKNQLCFEVLGGHIGKFAQYVPGEAQFKPNEEVLLFLGHRGHRFSTVGMSQGKYEIHRQGENTLVVPSADNPLVSHINRHGQTLKNNPREIPLAAFKNSIFEILERQNSHQ